ELSCSRDPFPFLDPFPTPFPFRRMVVPLGMEADGNALVFVPALPHSWKPFVHAVDLPQFHAHVLKLANAALRRPLKRDEVERDRCIRMATPHQAEQHSGI